ncbi:ATP-binding cassette domain-containing protein [Nocardioides jejuensis]|uniref:ATP-binding cassette domain-containing protein n=1 Tax=Nocardioides jejuensis TaxID=2502782 RepID=A0A4V2NXP3_9ACTN|nr:ATP-binding cassette domain-containing protein [Nocardioides jejuensis]TCJ22072.1 ATP-binding cassette domain-containing protein [Nocardioides jejuensis]
MTTQLPDLATQERLRVTTNGDFREFDADEVLGPLALQCGPAGWSARDVGEEPMLFLDGCRVVQLPLFLGRPVQLRVGAPDGQLVELEVVEYVESFLEYGPGDPMRGAMRPKPSEAGAADTDVVPVAAPALPAASAVAAVARVVTPVETPAPEQLPERTPEPVRVPVAAGMVEAPATQSVPEPAPAVSSAPPAPRRTPGVGPAAPSADERMLVLDGVNVTVEGTRLLRDISVALRPGTLTAVIGPSGAGKSTLLRALTGERPATSGRVVWDGHDLDRERDLARFRIGVVPQEELLHPQLSVRQELAYAAALRMPPTSTRAERDARVGDVLGRLGLEGQRDQRISSLSGGQRKRLAIAAELLTAPDLLFLDEPTTGLDPGFDRSVMEQLRDLAHDGCTVVAVTHSVIGLEACDQVVVLARGGRLAHVGAPETLLGHFGCLDYPELFDLLETGEVSPAAATVERPKLKAPGTLVVPERPAPAGQLLTLLRRTAVAAFSDRLTVAMLVLMPLLLGALSRVVPGGAGLSLTTAHANGVARARLGEEANQHLTLLLVAACLMGAAMTVREVVRERALLRREYAVGVSPGAWVFAKGAVLGLLCFVQGVAVTWLALAGLPGADAAGIHGWGTREIALSVGLLATASAWLGLLVSALVRTVEQTMPALVAVVMGQLVLSGALVQVAGRPGLEQVAWLAPARWAHAANAVSVHLERAKNGIRSAVPDPLAAYSTGQWTHDLVVLAVVAVVALLTTVQLVRRSLR